MRVSQRGSLPVSAETDRLGTLPPLPLPYQVFVRFRCDVPKRRRPSTEHQVENRYGCEIRSDVVD